MPFSKTGSTSLITFRSNVLGELTITEKDPTPENTTYGLLADFVNAER